jgi:hypothetical protein
LILPTMARSNHESLRITAFICGFIRRIYANKKIDLSQNLAELGDF